jgi:hypothetical protein
MHSRDLLTAAARHAADFLETLPEARVGTDVLDVDALREALALPMRVSVSNWATTLSDVDRSCQAILVAARERAAVPSGPPPS